MEKLISIIIPVYNVEAYLTRCLKSVFCQNPQVLKKAEIILIDDGSQDQSGLICDQFALKYPHIIVIHQKNGGLSDARNRGIEAANGKYLLFLDSDDQLQKDTLSNLDTQLKKDADIYVGRYCSLYNNQIIECPYKVKNEWEKYQGEALLQCILSQTEHYDWYAVLNIVKRELILKKNLWFAVGHHYEDALWTPDILVEAQKVVFWDYPFYIYTSDRKSSITKKFSIESYLDKLYVCNYQKKFCIEKGFSKTTSELLCGNLNLIYTSLLADYWKIPLKERTELWKHISNHKDILSFSKRNIDKYLINLSRIIGLKGISFLLHIRSEVNNH